VYIFPDNDDHIVNRNANSREIVAITVQENATGMMINTKNNASNRVLRN
jgi:hypothetical protein